MANVEATDRFAKLNERQRACLRHVFQHKKSQEIAHLLGASARAIDKQLMLAKNIIGAHDRYTAACQFAAYEAGVGSSYPVISLPSPTPLWPLPLPVPTSATPANRLTWQQVLIWGAIIAIVTPIGVTVAAMLIVVLTILFGVGAI